MPDDVLQKQDRTETMSLSDEQAKLVDAVLNDGSSGGCLSSTRFRTALRKLTQSEFSMFADAVLELSFHHKLTRDNGPSEKLMRQAMYDLIIAGKKALDSGVLRQFNFPPKTRGRVEQVADVLSASWEPFDEAVRGCQEPQGTLVTQVPRPGLSCPWCVGEIKFSGDVLRQQGLALFFCSVDGCGRSTYLSINNHLVKVLVGSALGESEDSTKAKCPECQGVSISCGTCGKRGVTKASPLPGDDKVEWPDHEGKYPGARWWTAFFEACGNLAYKEHNAHGAWFQVWKPMWRKQDRITIDITPWSNSKESVMYSEKVGSVVMKGPGASNFAYLEPGYSLEDAKIALQKVMFH